MSTILSYFRSQPQAVIETPLMREMIEAPVEEPVAPIVVEAPTPHSPPVEPKLPETIATVVAVAEATIVETPPPPYEQDEESMKVILRYRADASDFLQFTSDVMHASVRNNNRCIYIAYATNGAIIGGAIGGVIGATATSPAGGLGGAVIGAGVGAGIGAVTGLGIAHYHVCYRLEKAFFNWKKGQTQAIYEEFVLKFQKTKVLQVCYDRTFERAIDFPARDRCGHVFDADSIEEHIKAHGRCPVDTSVVLTLEDVKASPYMFGAMEMSLQAALKDKTSQTTFTVKELQGLAYFRDDLVEKTEKYFANERERAEKLRKSGALTERQHRDLLAVQSIEYLQGKASVV